MRLLIDTNILLDAVIGHAPYCDDADKILHLCASGKVDGIIAAHSIPNMFYILRHDFSEDERRAILRNLCQILYVESIDRTKLLSALDDSSFSDFEDCLQVKCAANARVNYIITRNLSDFAASPIPCLSASDFCAMYENKAN